jgi:adenylate kinase family enzyme
VRRVSVVGTSSTGKTTFARRLAATLGVPAIELDALHFGPNWTEVPADEFERRLRAAIEGREGWVIDGNYADLRPITWPLADTVVWLDYPLPTILARLTRRTLRRVARREELWHGNRENLRTHLMTRDSLFWWVLTTHRGRRERMQEWLSRPEYAHLEVRRFRSPRAAERWLAGVEAGAPASHEPMEAT